MKVQKKTIPVVNVSIGVKTHGLKAGKLSVFIELYNPNVINPFVPVQSDKHHELYLEQILGQIEMCGDGCKEITITGPEPLFTPNIDELLKLLDSKEYFVEVDTFGNASISDHRVKRTSTIAMLNKLYRPSNIRFLLYYSSGNSLYRRELEHLSPEDTFICRIRSEEDLDECIRLAKRHTQANICFVPVSALIGPDVVMKRIAQEKLWRVKYQPSLQDIITFNM